MSAKQNSTLLVRRRFQWLWKSRAAGGTRHADDFGILGAVCNRIVHFTEPAEQATRAATRSRKQTGHETVCRYDRAQARHKASRRPREPPHLTGAARA